ncbi:hypothetical protein KEM55_002559 [Ascosphaera atra]|nr:hypothetical protein KEM55_002559 [Ascosphaera atra]
MTAMSAPDAGTYPRPPRLLQRAAHFLAWLFPPNFITFHYAYYIFTVLLSSVILWGASTPSHSASVRYIDALFLCVSAMTLSGLNTVDLSSLNTFQQVILFLLTIIGSPVLVSWVVVAIRKKAFEKRFKSIVESQKRAAAAAAAEEEEASAAQSDNSADNANDANVPTDSVTVTAISTPVLSHDHDIKQQPPTTTSCPFDLSLTSLNSNETAVRRV